MRRALLPVIVVAAALLAASPASAHEEDGGYPIGEDPGDIVELPDCTLLQRNFAAPYLLDYRLEPDVVAGVVRIEVVSDDAWVAGFTIASPNWRAHRELPDSIAHADRLAPGDPSAGLLLRLGFERKDGAYDVPSTTFSLRLLTEGAASPSVIELVSLRAEGFTDPGSVELFRQWCHEPVPAGVAPTGTSTAPADGSDGTAGVVSEDASGGFPVVPVVPVVLAGLGLLGAASLLLLLRRRH